MSTLIKVVGKIIIHCFFWYCLIIGCTFPKIGFIQGFCLIAYGLFNLIILEPIIFVILYILPPSFGIAYKNVTLPIVSEKTMEFKINTPLIFIGNDQYFSFKSSRSYGKCEVSLWLENDKFGRILLSNFDVKGNGGYYMEYNVFSVPSTIVIAKCDSPGVLRISSLEYANDHACTIDDLKKCSNVVDGYSYSY